MGTNKCINEKAASFRSMMNFLWFLSHKSPKLVTKIWFTFKFFLHFTTLESSSNKEKNTEQLLVNWNLISNNIFIKTAVWLKLKNWKSWKFYIHKVWKFCTRFYQKNTSTTCLDSNFFGKFSKFSNQNESEGCNF